MRQDVTTAELHEESKQNLPCRFHKNGLHAIRSIQRIIEEQRDKGVAYRYPTLYDTVQGPSSMHV